MEVLKEIVCQCPGGFIVFQASTNKINEPKHFMCVCSTSVTNNVKQNIVYLLLKYSLISLNNNLLCIVLQSETFIIHVSISRFCFKT